MNDTIDENIPTGEPSVGAMSVYGQGATEEFPVLKAFQQYIDAEQSKARKRMIGLCMFFAVLMTIVIGLFMFMLHESNEAKQQANDQLIKMLLADREHRPSAAWPVPVATGTSAGNDAALRAVTDALTALQQKIADERSKPAAAALPEQKSADEERLARAELEHERRMQKADEKLRRQREALEAEKRKLADEKEKLRLQEVERQRRRLYPEYYAQKQQKEASSAPAPQPAAKSTVKLSQKDIDEILAEADAARETAALQVSREYATKNPSAKTKAASPSAAAEKKHEPKSDEAGSKKSVKDDKTDDDEVIEYFKDDEYTLPVKVDGKAANWSVAIPAVTP